MNYDSYKEQVIYTCNDIIDNCDRMTSGNYMHNINAIKLMAKTIRDNCLPHLSETPQSPWISVEDRLPDRLPAKFANWSKEVFVAVKRGRDYRAYVDKYSPIYKTWGVFGDEVTHWMPIPELPKEE